MAPLINLSGAFYILAVCGDGWVLVVFRIFG